MFDPHHLYIYCYWPSLKLMSHPMKRKTNEQSSEVLDLMVPRTALADASAGLGPSGIEPEFRRFTGGMISRTIHGVKHHISGSLRRFQGIVYVVNLETMRIHANFQGIFWGFHGILTDLPRSFAKRLINVGRFFNAEASSGSFFLVSFKKTKQHLESCWSKIVIYIAYKLSILWYPSNIY